MMSSVFTVDLILSLSTDKVVTPLVFPTPWFDKLTMRSQTMEVAS